MATYSHLVWCQPFLGNQTTHRASQHRQRSDNVGLKENEILMCWHPAVHGQKVYILQVIYTVFQLKLCALGYCNPAKMVRAKQSL